MKLAFLDDSGMILSKEDVPNFSDEQEDEVDIWLENLSGGDAWQMIADMVTRARKRIAPLDSSKTPGPDRD